jgi:hypothetical protein
MENDSLADELDTLDVGGDDDVLAAEEAIWEALDIKGPQPEFLKALRGYRRAVLVACARHHEVHPKRWHDKGGPVSAE